MAITILKKGHQRSVLIYKVSTFNISGTKKAHKILMGFKKDHKGMSRIKPVEIVVDADAEESFEEFQFKTTSKAKADTIAKLFKSVNHFTGSKVLRHEETIYG